METPQFWKMKKYHHILHSSEKIQMSISYKLLQIVTKIYYKLRQVNYYQFYYKVRHLLQIVTSLL